MQTCPKNVHTGPLIGSSSKTSKGPVQSTSHHTAPTIIDTAITMNIHQPQTTAMVVGGNGGQTTSSSSSSVIGGGIITCKLEDGPIVVKPETVDSHLYIHSVADVRGDKSSYDNLQHVHAPHPNFSLNSKILEPETSVSPARGSTGLPMPQPTQGSAAQPNEQHMVRRARVGKSMAREMMMQPHHHNHHHHGTNAGGNGNSGSSNIGSSGNITPGNHHHHVMHSQTHIDAINTIDGLTSTTLFNGTGNKNKEQHSSAIEIKQEIDLIKKEDMKIECDDDVVLLLEKPDEPIPRISLINDGNKKCNNFSIVNTNIDRNSICHQSSLVNDTTEIINLIDNDNGLDDDYSNASTPINVRKRKILELNRHQCKKSPPNSYKSLIKQSEPKPYLCTAEPRRRTSSQSMPKRSRYRLIKGGQRYRTQQRKIIINGKHKKLLITSSKKVKRRILKRKLVNRDPPPNLTQSIDLTTTSSVSGDDADPIDHQSTASTALCTDTDNPTIISVSNISTPDAPPHTPSSPQQTDSAIADAAAAVTATTDDIDACSDISDQRQSSEKQLFMSKLELLTDADAAAVIAEKRKRCASDENLSLMILNRIQLNDRRRSKSESKRFESMARDRSKSSSKSKDRKSLNETILDRSLGDNKKTLPTKTTTKKGKKSTAKNSSHLNNTMILDYTDGIINNNNIMYDNNNKIYHHPLTNNRSTGGKKTKSRGAKFSNKKRRRIKHVQEIEEIVIPRRTTALPRWSNGWHWEGPSFRGKVFLNVSFFFRLP